MHKNVVVYYIDDEPELCEIFQETLEGLGFELHTFTDPHLAIAASKKQHVDVVVIDYRLPNTTGDKVALLMDSPGKTILLTGEIQINSEFDFDLILYKPINFADLIPILREQN
jgi:CheY-like chemotaxis protein